MNARFKWIVLIFAFLLLGGLIGIQFLPKPKLSFTERQKLTELVKRMNANLPREIGTIGRMDKVSFHGNALTYHYSIYGSPVITQFYKENHVAIQELLMYVVLIMNGQSDMGTAFSRFLYTKGILIAFEIKIPNGEIFRWQYNGKELLQFAETLRLTPTEALMSVIDTQLKLMNLFLPLSTENLNVTSLQSIPVNTIAKTMATEERLLQIKREGNNIIFVIETEEFESNIEPIRSHTQNPLFCRAFFAEMTEDADVREFISLFAIAHSNITYRLQNKDANDSIDISIPYSIISEFCSISNPLN